MTYSDYPECLPRYAWLIKEATKSPNSAAVLFHGRGYCKACGAQVAGDGQTEHARQHARQLAEPRRAAQEAAADRLRAMNAARAASPFVPMTLDDLARETR